MQSDTASALDLTRVARYCWLRQDCFFFALAHSRAHRWHREILQLVPGLGAFSIVAALVVSSLQEFRRIASQDWGATPSPQLIFGAIYAVASLAALLGISINLRRHAAAGEGRSTVEQTETADCLEDSLDVLV